MTKKFFYIGLPIYEDGFIEMEFDFCENRFMLHSNIFEDVSYLHFFCSILRTS